MKNLNSIKSSGSLLKHLALALMLGAGSAQAQVIIEVGGPGIADQALTTSKVPTLLASNWQVVGNNGGVYSGLVSPTLVVANTGAVTLTFQHRYNFEATYDGAAVFVSINDGPFTYVPLASFTSGGYDTTGNVDPLSGTAWVNTNVFGGKSVGYDTPTLITSVANLGTLNATDTVAVEFRGGWDGASLNGPVAWEIGSVQITDPLVDLLNKNFIADGASNFTVADIGAMTAPWAYPKAINRFEINATTLAADRYQPNIVGSAIDFDGAIIEVVRIPGTTLVANSTFSLFDLSGGTTLTGAPSKIILPGGKWDTSNLTVDGTIKLLTPAPLGIYEPFDYAGALLNGASGATEYGLKESWSASTSAKLGGGRTFGSLVTRGGGIADLSGGSNNFGGSRGVTTEAFAQYNLLNDGATIWFSVIMGYDVGGNVTNSRLAVAFGKGALSPGNNQYYMANAGASGLGVVLGGSGVGSSKVAATHFKEFGQAFVPGTLSPALVSAGQSGLIVGKITWNANPLLADTIELYAPGADLALPGAPVSTLSAIVDQSTFDTLSWSRGDRIVLDEIRFGDSYASVTETGSHWDLNDTTAGSGGPTPTGTWDAGSKWNAVPAGTDPTAPWVAADVAIFAAGTDATGTYSVTVDGTQDIGGVQFKEGSVTLTGGTALRATTDTHVSVAPGLTATIATPLTENLAGRQLAKNGEGTLVLSGSNSGLTGGTRVYEGAMQFESLSAIPGTARNVVVNPTAAVAFGSGVSLGDIATALADRITADSPGVIAADNQAATNFAFNTPGLTAASFGALGPVSYTGILTPNGTTYRLGGGGGTLTMANANALTGPNSLEVNPTVLANPGTVVLGAANDYTGTTTVNLFSTLRIMGATATSGITVNSSFLEFGDDNALGAGTLTLNNVSTITGLGSRVTTNPVQANGSFTITGIDSLTLGTMTLNNNVTITNNNISATTTYAAITAMGGNRSLSFSGNANSVVTGGIGGPGGGADVTTLGKNGTGTLTLNSANTHTGTTTVSGGLLLLNDAEAIPGGNGATGGTTGVTINGGVIGLGTGNFSRPLAAANTAGAVTMSGNGGWAAFGADRLVNLGGSLSPALVEWVTANTGLNAKTIILSHATATHKVTLQNPIVLGTAARTVQVDNGSASVDAELSGNLTGSSGGNLSKTGAGTLVLSGNNTIVGTTTVSAGTLILSGDNTLTGLMSCAAANSTLTLTGNNTAGAAGVTLNNATAVLNVNSNNALGTGTVTLQAGTFDNTSGSPKTLTTNNTVALTGNTIWGGGNNLTFGTGPVNLNASRTLTLNGSGILAFGGVLTNTQAGNPTLTVNGAGKTMVVNGAALSNSGTLRAVTVTGTGNLAITGAVVGSSTSASLNSTLTMSGTGTLTLQGNNTYIGATTVNTGGELHLKSGSQTSAITVNSGAFVGFTPGSPITSTAALNINTGHKVRINVAPVAPNSYTLITAASIGGTASATPALEFPITDYELVKDGNTLMLNYIGVSDPYAAWATGSEPFDGDANGDGVKDGLAFLLGALNPSENAIGRLPTVTQSGGNLVMTFNCLPLVDRGTATLKVSHSNDLATWSPTVDVVPDADDAIPDNNVTFVVGAGPVGPPALKTVTATIGSGAAAVGKLFGRLEAVQP